MVDDCLFCKIVAGELPSEIVQEDEHTIAFMDINPWTRGHALVVPRTTREPLRGRRGRSRARVGGREAPRDHDAGAARLRRG